MIKFIAFTCCATCEHKQFKDRSSHGQVHFKCDLDDSDTDDYLVCGQWIMSEYLKKFTNTNH